MKTFTAAYLFAILLVALPVLSAPVPIDSDGELLVKRAPTPGKSKGSKNNGGGSRHSFNIGLQLPTGQQEQQHPSKRSFSEDGSLLEKRGKSKGGKKSKQGGGGGGHTFNLGVHVPGQEEQHPGKRSFAGSDGENMLEKRFIGKLFRAAKGVAKGFLGF